MNEREQNFINKLFVKAPTFEYICGYSGCENKVLLRCKICGYKKTISAQCIRKGHGNITCNNCDSYIKTKSKIEKYIDSITKKYYKKVNKELHNLKEELRKNTIYIKKCKRCGKELITEYSFKVLCDRCAIRKYDKNHSNKSLKKLYKRDKGICWICGFECDYKDFIYRNNTFIAGNYYPSIDHVIPLNKGGTDNWDNLRLAHRICNSLKSIDDRS